jgi:hypothetical protein
LHVVRRENNPNVAFAKSGERVAPLDFLTVQAFDSWAR